MKLNFRDYLIHFFLIIIFFIFYNNTVLGQMCSQDVDSKPTQEPSSSSVENISDEIDRLLGLREEEFRKKNTEICLSTRDIILSSGYITEFFWQCSERLRFIIEMLLKRNRSNDDLYHGYVPEHIVLVGPPGVGKSTIAVAIAQAAEIPYTFIRAMTLANEYINSGPSNLLRIFDPILAMNEPHIVIIDELQTLIKKRDNNEFDMAAAEVLWMLLDECRVKKNILIIATANDISNLPEQLKSRFAKSIYEIKLPGLMGREKIIQHYLATSKANTKNLSEKIINSLARTIRGFSPRNIEDGISIALSRAFFRAQELGFKDIILTKDDLNVGFGYIKKQKNDSFFPQWCKNFVKHLGAATVISLGLTVTQMALHIFLQYCDRKAYLALTQAHHNELIQINMRHNQALLGQSERFHQAKIS